MKCGRQTCTSKARPTVPWCNAHYDAELRRREAQGGRKCGRIPVGPVLEHIAKLKANGLGNRRIAELSGITLQSVQRLKHHPLTYVDTAHKILSVRPDTALAADSAKVPVLGSMRRLQALNCVGYMNRELAQKLGVSDNLVHRWVNGTQPFIFAEKARAVDKLFRELQLASAPDTVGGSRAKLRALRNGWAPPLAWNLEDLDNPEARPDLGAEPDFQDAIADARSLGRDDHAIAASMGIQVDSLRTRIRREKRRAA